MNALQKHIEDTAGKFKIELHLVTMSLSHAFSGLLERRISRDAELCWVDEWVSPTTSSRLYPGSCKYVRAAMT